MRIKHYARGKFYTIQCPEGSSLIRRSGLDDCLTVPLNGEEVRIPADPPELLPMLAESGNFGVTLVGVPEPAMEMRGVACPDCGQDDITWLQLMDDEAVHCDSCGGEFSATAPLPGVGPRPVREAYRGPLG